MLPNIYVHMKRWSINVSVKLLESFRGLPTPLAAPLAVPLDIFHRIPQRYTDVRLRVISAFPWLESFDHSALGSSPINAMDPRRLSNIRQWLRCIRAAEQVISDHNSHVVLGLHPHPQMQEASEFDNHIKYVYKTEQEVTSKRARQCIVRVILLAMHYQ